MPGFAVLRDRRFNGYLGFRLPHELDDVVTSLVVAYEQAPPARRTQMLDDLRPRPAGLLSVYGQRMAAMAVRTGSVEPLRRGLIAMGIGHGLLEDYRDNLVVLTAVSHSAGLLEVSLAKEASLAKLVSQVRELIPEAAHELFRTYAARPRGSLASMGLQACGSGADFRYCPGPVGP